MAQDTARAISADSHICEPPDCYTRFIEARFKGEAPHVIRDAQRGDMFVVKDREPMAMAFISNAGRDPRDHGVKCLTYPEFHQGGWIPSVRLKDQDRDGVTAEVLFPSLGMSLSHHPDRDYRHAVLWAYNRWLEEFCGYARDRLLGVGTPALRSVPEGVEELRRLKEMGMKAVMLPSNPELENDYDHAMWDPLWRTSVELDLPISFHALTGRNDTTTRGPVLNWWNTAMRSVQDLIGTFIFGGVFDRHPKLKLVAAECDAGWIPHFMYRMDHVFERHRYSKKAVSLARLPSEYFRDNVYVTFQDDWTVFKVVHLLNHERLMWANDFPHGDATWPNSQKLLAEQTAGLAPEVKDRILRANVRELYKLN
jgi:predicted TIM-barrel fold metal-dependent hydrolase